MLSRRVTYHASEVSACPRHASVGFISVQDGRQMAEMDLSMHPVLYKEERVVAMAIAASWPLIWIVVRVVFMGPWIAVVVI
jgi:hypothetical protein